MMTTAEFIAKTYNTTNDKWGRYGYERRCSSVLTDRWGTVYSYGYHYPLAFNVRGLDFINEQGYSTTTAKHINWAREAMNYDYVGVKLWRKEAQVISSSFSTEDEKLEAIITAIKRERDALMGMMATKKRKDTQVYEMLQARLTKVLSNLSTAMKARQ